VIGIGYRPLEKRAREILECAEVILASSRLADVFGRYDEYQAVKDRITVINKVPDTITFIQERLSRAGSGPVVLLASGDPLFFGIGRRICEEFGKERVEILPDLSSVQQAFARINEPWDDAFFMSLHGGPDIAKRRKLPYEISHIPQLLQQHGKLGILTDRENNPAMIAGILEKTSGQISVFVCERLGYPDENIFMGTPGEIASRSFSDPNVVILMKDREKPRVPASCFGLREDEIEHERGLITKDEVRAVTLHKLRLPAQGVMWDIGAGSGSVSLEAARLCPGLRIFAIEKEGGRCETIRKNMAALSVRNVDVIQGSAPDALQGVSAPDRVFVGGSGGNIEQVVKLVSGTMVSGIILVNCATLETLNDAITALEHYGYSVDVAEISVSRSKKLAGKRQMAALNPVFMVKGEK
jgi:precorrin-6Y C5,15-methyltransferase (decarboxylating)